MEQKNLDQIIRETVARYMKRFSDRRGKLEDEHDGQRRHGVSGETGTGRRKGDDLSTVYNPGSSCRRVPQERNYLWTAEFPL